MPSVTIGTSIFLIAVGAILRYAVQDEWSAVDIPTVGLILMIVGAFGLVLGIYMTFIRDGGAGGPPRGGPPPEQPPGTPPPRY